MRAVFLGGSITYGSGASDPELTSYRALVSSALQDRYGVEDFESVNAGIGGTTSEFALVRLERDVWSYQPDVVFVEFAVNDGDLDPDWRAINFSSLLMALKNHHSRPGVVVILTGLVSSNLVDQAKHIASRECHRLISESLGCPVIDCGQALFDLFAAGARVEDYLPDNVHPNDAGYKVYASTILDALASIDLSRLNNQGAELKIQSRFWQPTQVVLAEKYGDAFSHPVVTIKNEHFDRAWELSTCESPFIFHFQGNILGLVWWISADAGAIRWRIDDGDWVDTQCWDEYAIHFNRIQFTLLSRELDDEAHRLEVVVINNVPGDTGGDRIRIAGLAVGKFQSHI